MVFVLICLFLTALWLGGGASRPDVFGQIIVRMSACVVLLMLAIFGRRSAVPGQWPVAVLLGAAIVLVAAQLVPLPTTIWSILPARDMFTGALSDARMSRSLSLSPGATINSLLSLGIPLTTFLLLLCLNDLDRQRLPLVLIAMAIMTAIVGTLQFSGFGIDNPMVNESFDQVSGIFANRNHFALFLACICLTLPAFVFADERQLHWRVPFGAGLLSIFVLMILTSGSRAGILLAALAVILAPLIARRKFAHALRHYPRWVPVAFVVGGLCLVAAVVALSIFTDRAVSIDRLFDADVNADMRRRALPTTLAMMREMLPFGAGAGTFDAFFRISEPLDLLKPTYFNHAHNDVLEIILDTGLAGLILLLVGLVWFAISSVRVWRAEVSHDMLLGRTGSAILFVILAASLVDYPARTPLVMALVIIAASWLGEGAATARRSALPRHGERL